jgi:hypothetical protein
MLLKPEILINKLWDDFQLYIKGSWTLPIEFGAKDGKVKKRILLQDFGEFLPLSYVQPQMKFCQVLCEILKYNLSQKDKEGFKIPHENTMRGYLKAGLSSTTQKNTLNAFAAFLGYEHWDDYRRKNSTNVIGAYKADNVKAIIDTVKEIKKTVTKKISIKPRLFAFSGIGILICVIIFIFYSKTNNSKESIEDEKRKIISTVRQANKAEFEAYSKIPVLDTPSLDHFFINHPEGSARAFIIGALTRRKEAGCILVTSMSSYNLIDVEVKNIQDTVAYLTTTEKWHLRWFDTLRKEDVLVYDTTNKHDYILVKQNATWKILMDNYNGRLRKPYFASREESSVQ